VQLLADWLTVTVWPPTVMVPVRELPVLFTATLKLNDPSPDMPPLVIVIQGTVLTGVHAQLEPVTTEMLLLSPADDADTVVGEALYVHCASAARTSSPHHEATSSASVTPPRRSVMHILCSTRRDTIPLMNDACRSAYGGPWGLGRK
jgi:hypothetical protein